MEKRSFWEEKRKSDLVSLFLLLFLFILYISLALFIYRFISPSFGGVVFLISLIYGLSFVIDPFSHTAFFLGARRVKNPSEIELKRAKNIVEELSIAALLPKPPNLFLIESDALNAYAVSIGDKAAIGVTRGLVKELNREELEGVIAHEISHIVHRDSQVKLFAFAVVAMIGLIAEIFLRVARYYRGDRRRGGGKLFFFLVGIVIAIFATILSKIIFFALSREREKMADVEAVRLTRNKEGLISALKKVASKSSLDVPYGASALFFENPSKKGFLSIFNDILSTHPPIEERIKLLESL